jgi:transcriptional regulator
MPSESFRASDPWSIVEAWPFATLVALPSGEVAHAPLLLEPDRSLVGHVAGSGRFAAALRAGAGLLAIFAGPHAYVSPFDYDAAGREAGRHVPTWNYVAAHVRGHAAPIDEPAHARAVLARLGERFDARGWTDAGLPEGYRASLVAGVLAFRFVPSSVEGVEKLGQNRTPEEREAAGRALLRRASEPEQQIGRRMLALR